MTCVIGVVVTIGVNGGGTCREAYAGGAEGSIIGAFGYGTAVIWGGVATAAEAFFSFDARPMFACRRGSNAVGGA